MGENGAGKTTLVKLLGRLYDPSAGTITVDGHDLRTLDAGAWRTSIAVIFQDFLQYYLTAAENIGFGQVDALDDQRADRRRRRPQRGRTPDRAPAAGIPEVPGPSLRGWGAALRRRVAARRPGPRLHARFPHSGARRADRCSRRPHAEYDVFSHLVNSPRAAPWC